MPRASCSTTPSVRTAGRPSSSPSRAPITVIRRSWTRRGTTPRRSTTPKAAASTSPSAHRIPRSTRSKASCTRRCARAPRGDVTADPDPRARSGPGHRIGACVLNPSLSVRRVDGAGMPDARGESAPYGNASRERFVLSRRYPAGTGGVRGLLITVLGDYVRPAGRAVPTSAFIDALGRFGVEEMACRQALIRASADGWLTSTRQGRYTWWRLSPAFQEFLNGGAKRIFGFTATQPDWDGRWLVVLARVPESNRAGRHLVRTRMRWGGFG